MKTTTLLPNFSGWAWDTMLKIPAHEIILTNRFRTILRNIHTDAHALYETIMTSPVTTRDGKDGKISVVTACYLTSKDLNACLDSLELVDNPAADFITHDTIISSSPVNIYFLVEYTRPAPIPPRCVHTLADYTEHIPVSGVTSHTAHTAVISLARKMDHYIYNNMPEFS